jgi:hypothetical protein
MKKLLPYARQLSAGLALVLGMTGLAFSGATFLPSIAEQADTASTLILGVAAFSGAAMLFGFAIYFATLVSLVVAGRGRTSLAFAPLSDCNDLAGWLCFSWNFFGEGGQQEGLRFFGLEVALQGRL